jgi:uncharacterized protein (TIGR02246 family)
MNRTLGLGILFLLVCATAIANPAVENEIKTLNDQFVAAWNHHDTKAMASMWAPDGDLINPFGKTAKGTAELEKLFATEHAGPLKGTTYKVSKMSVRPLTADLAVADYDVEITGMMGPDGKAQPALTPHVTSVMKKANGKWWILSARAFSYMPAPPMPAAAKK